MADSKPAKADDLESVRKIVAALQPFKLEEQERILRWAREKVGLEHPSDTQGGVRTARPTPHPGMAEPPVPVPQVRSIRDFVAEKNPKSDNQFAAVVAYYYRFEAPEERRKESITSDDLQEACRQAGRPRLPYPNKTLNNAHGNGLLDRAGDRGAFRINSVGENLVAMTLPGGGTGGTPRARASRTRGTKKPRPKLARKRR